MIEADLTIKTLAYWHCGTGRGQSAALDAIAARDELGLPLVPGRTVKGLLRDAVRRYASLGHCASGWTTALFGSEGFGPPRHGEEAPTPSTRTQPGKIAVTSAFVDREVRDWFREAERTMDSVIVAQRRATLFRTISATAIDPDRGVARVGSLRTVEVVVPLTLKATVSIADIEACDIEDRSQTAVAVLTHAVALIGALGAHRTRGLGRCVVSLAPVGGERP